LVDPGGEILAEDEAIPPLNIIPVDRSLPLLVYFDDEIEGSFTAFVELVSALPVPRNDERYLNAWIEIEEVEISLEGEQASVYGEVGLPSRSQSAGIVWLAAVAYDEEEKVVAVRKIELNSSIEPGTARPFEIDLYSLGPEIDRVDVLVEARP
jgi:hypothetical protein